MLLHRETRSPSGWPVRLALFALLVASTVAQHELWRNPSFLPYHPRFKHLFEGWGSLWIGVVVAQAVVALWVLQPYLRRLQLELRRLATRPALWIGLALTVAGSSIAIPHVALERWYQFSQSLVVGTAGMVVGALGLAALAVATPIAGLHDRIGAGIDRAAWWQRPSVLAGGHFLAAAVIAVVVYETIPQIPDTVSAYWHARYFAAGYLSLPAVPEPDAFSVYLIVHEDGRQFAHSSPGWPALLALGMRLAFPT